MAKSVVSSSTVESKQSVKSDEIPPVDEDCKELRTLNLYSELDLLKKINEYLLDFLPKSGFPINHRWENIKLGITSLSLVFGIYGQFFVGDLKNRWTLLAIVCAFFSCSFAYVLFDYFVSKYNFTVVKGDKGIIVIDSFIPMQSGEWWLVARTSKGSLTVRSSAAQYFDVEGYLVHELVFKHTINVLKRFESGERDNADVAKELNTHKHFRFF